MNDDLRRWLPWIGVAVVAIIVIAIIAVNQGDDDDEAAADTTTTVAEETTTTEGETTTTEGETTTTEGETTTTAAPVAFEPVPLKVGSILPQTGQLASIIEAVEGGVRMGEEEVNAVSPGLVDVTYSDSGTDPNVASAAIDEYLTGEFSAIVGPASTNVTLGVFDKVNESEITMCSGSNTGAALSAATYDPYYTRTAPSDEIQGPTLAGLVLADGFSNVAVVWRAEEYGRGLGESVADNLEAGGAEVVIREGYDFAAASFADLAGTIAGSGAEAVVMITFDEGGQILQDLAGAGFDGQIYVADGFKDTVTVDSVGGNAALLEGLRGTAPSSSPENGEPTFADRFAVFAPDTPTIFSAHFYDCLVVSVLAAQEAQSDDPSVFVANMVTVTRDGEKCTTFDACFALLEQGADIDYDGASGPLDFGENAEPTIGTYDLFEYDAEGSPVSFEQSVGSL